MFFLYVGRRRHDVGVSVFVVLKGGLAPHVSSKQERDPAAGVFVVRAVSSSPRGEAPHRKVFFRRLSPWLS